jgi:hypothetical protein
MNDPRVALSSPSEPNVTIPAPGTSRQERQQTRSGAHDVDGDYQLARIEAIDGVSGDRREDENGQRLAEKHQRCEGGRYGELQDEVEQRDGQKPIAAAQAVKSAVIPASVEVSQPSTSNPIAVAPDGRCTGAPKQQSLPFAHRLNKSPEYENPEFSAPNSVA